MFPEVVQVEPSEGFTLLLTFSNGERRLFSVEPYLERGVFSELKDRSYFRSVRVVSGVVQWPHEQDLSPETLYLRSQPVVAKSSTV